MYADGLLVGVVVAKVGIARLRHWVAHAGTFVADDNGVIIMAHNSELEGHALPNSRVTQMSLPSARPSICATRFPTSRSASDSQVREQAPWVPPPWPGNCSACPSEPMPSLYQTRGGLNSGLSAHLVDPLVAWPELLRNHKRDHLLVFLTLAGTVALAWVITVSYVRERRHHRATRDLAEQLQSANTLLSAEARHDALTGALSRRYFLDLLRHEIERAHAGNEPLCMAIADLDHFKQINDRFGHAAGDRALEHFVDTCRAELRGADAIGRLGGEEFGLLLPATDLAGGHEVGRTLAAASESGAFAEVAGFGGLEREHRHHRTLARRSARADHEPRRHGALRGEDRAAATAPKPCRPTTPRRPRARWPTSGKTALASPARCPHAATPCARDRCAQADARQAPPRASRNEAGMIDPDIEVAATALTGDSHEGKFGHRLSRSGC